MQVDVDLILFSEDKELGNEKNFINFLIENWSDKIRIWETGILGGKVGIKEYKQDDPPIYMPFDLIAGYDDKIKASALTFRTDVMDAASRADILLFYDVFFTACKEFKPIYACADETRDDERPCMDWAEYCKDPFLFCLEPPILLYLFDFIRNKDVLSKLNEI